MPVAKKPFVIEDLRKGRNGYDPSWAIEDDQCADAINVDFYKSRCGNKRGGMLAIGTTAITCTGVISSMYRHVPGANETAAEMHVVDDSATPIANRLAGGTSFAAMTFKDAPTGNGWDFRFASINGKCGYAYKSATARFHYWDGTTIRRAGLAASGVVAVTNTGGGTYAAVPRYYRERSTVQSGGVTIRRSEPSASTAFTPSGGGTAAHITQASVINEGETHWEVEASTDNVTFYVIATVVIGTTTYDDSAATTSYSSNPLSELTGKYTLQKPYIFCAADQNRLLGFGSYTTTDKQNRIEISAVIGSSNISDEERVDTSQVNSYVDLDENDSGDPTGLHGPVLGSFLAFKARQVWQLTATGSTDRPYRQDAISKSVGAVGQEAITRGDDAIGNAAVYYWSHRGPYRWGIAGNEYIGKGIEDYVLGPTATVNLSASKRIAVACYYPDKRQVWFWWGVGETTGPNMGAIFDVQTGGWTIVPSGDLWAAARCAALFSNTIATAMSRDLKPHIGQSGGAVRIWKGDTGTDDNGTAYKAYIVTKDFEPGGQGVYGEVGDIELLAKVSSGVTITATVTGDFGEGTTKQATGTALLTAIGTETRISKRLEGSALSGDVKFIRIQIGDAAAVSNSWSLDRIVVMGGRNDRLST